MSWDSEARQRQLETWILQCLASDPSGLRVRELRMRLWDLLPVDVRSSWEVLVIGDQVSKSLNALLRQGVVVHHRSNARWQIVDRSKQLPAPQTQDVPAGEQGELFPKNPSIRPAQAADHPGLLVIWRQAVEATHDFLTPADIDAIEQDVTRYLPQLPDVRLAEDTERGTIVGFAAAEGDFVHMLFVDPQAQGQGVGTRLLESVTDGRESVRVDVNEQNPFALAFYTARGFSVVGRSETDGQGRPFPLLHLQRR